MRSRADDHHLRRLLGMEPARGRCAPTRRPRARGRRRPCRRRRAGGSVCRCSADGRHRPRHQVEEDREVVRRRVPPHVRVAPDAAHAEALEGEMEDVAQPAGVDDALHLAHQRIVEEGLVDEEHPVGGARRRRPARGRRPRRARAASPPRRACRRAAPPAPWRGAATAAWRPRSRRRPARAMQRGEVVRCSAGRGARLAPPRAVRVEVAERR